MNISGMILGNNLFITIQYIQAYSRALLFSASDSQYHRIHRSQSSKFAWSKYTHYEQLIQDFQISHFYLFTERGI